MVIRQELLDEPALTVLPTQFPKQRSLPTPKNPSDRRYPLKVTKSMGKKKVARRGGEEVGVVDDFDERLDLGSSGDLLLSHRLGDLQRVPAVRGPFIKVVNYAHLLPTRYQLELESLKGSVSSDTFKEPTQREDSKKAQTPPVPKQNRLEPQLGEDCLVRCALTLWFESQVEVLSGFVLGLAVFESGPRRGWEGR
jgi:hypothetical protein